MASTPAASRGGRVTHSFSFNFIHIFNTTHLGPLGPHLIFLLNLFGFL